MDVNIIETRGLTKTYGGNSGSGNAVHALRGIDVDVRLGELTLLVGPSGCGKTTLISVVAGLLDPTAGDVEVLGEDLAELRGRRLVEFRGQNIGFVFQQYNLLPALTAAENAAVPLLIAGWNRGRAVERAKEVLEQVGLADRVRHRPRELSGGQQQRVAIARALVNNPAIILADEPTGNLDTKSGAEIMALFDHLNKEQGLTVVLVTHDPEIGAHAGRIIHIRDGLIEQPLEEPVAGRRSVWERPAE
jgi:putative ABC transport system ATP-binding protein